MNRGDNIGSIESSSTPYIHLAKKRNGSLVPSARDIEAENTYTEQSSVLVASLYELPNDTEGLDIDRINKFLDSIGASKKPQLFFRPTMFKEALKLIGSNSQEPSGLYFEGLGISLVQRDLALEALNGTALTESFAIHEAVHSTHIESPVRLVHGKQGIWNKPTVSAIPTPRVYNATPDDLLSPNFGNLFEEGYAELERGLYIQTNDLTDQFTRGSVNYAQLKQTPIPLHYTYKISAPELEGKQLLTFTPGVFGATVFEILMKHDDGLLPTLRKSRHDSDGLRETAESINKLVPGLYNVLQHASSQEEMVVILTEVLKDLSN